MHGLGQAGDAVAGRKPVAKTIWTMGHSTRPLDAFLELLAHFRLEALENVRCFPGSQRHPQVHILVTKHIVVHPYTSPVRVVRGRLSYAPADVDGFREVAP